MRLDRWIAAALAVGVVSIAPVAVAQTVPPRFIVPESAEGNVAPPGTSEAEGPDHTPREPTPLEKVGGGAQTVDPAADPAPTYLAPLVWKDEWARVGKANYALIGASAALSVGFSVLKPLGNHNFEKPLLFDEGARRAIRIGSLNGRFTGRDVSDVLLSLETTWPIMIDAFVVAYGVRKSPEVAWEMAIIDAEVIALTSAVQAITAWAVSRPRPYLGDCGGSVPSELNDCVRNGRFRSFYSGHASMAFAGASLICAHRARLELFSKGADVATCVTAYVAAAATGALRMAGDMHNATDVITGAIIGTAIGLGIPALHYRHRDRKTAGKPMDYDVTLYPTGAGVGLAVTY